jgi:hypothetical protein
MRNSKKSTAVTAVNATPKVQRVQNPYPVENVILAHNQAKLIPTNAANATMTALPLI